MKIYNTLTRKKEYLIPRIDGKIQMYVCGPTVHDYIHIGNARTFVIFDVIAKYLRHSGFEVDYIQNITDIDNKIIDKAQAEGSDPLEYAKRYTEFFLKDVAAVEITSPKYKNATDHIDEVIKQVKKLMENGSAYVIDGDGIYFDLSTFPDYGKLSGRTAEMADDAVSRIDDSDKKRNRGDFVLWKFDSHAGDPSWPAPFGNGRPGWHIEDTGITEKYFGPQYDLHGGGQDLIFPHHEAEIAQQESASGLKPFVKYWMHPGFLINKEKKMSKSLGNFRTLRNALEEYPPEALRFYFLSGHYHSPLDYSEDRLKSAEAAVQRLNEFWHKLHAIKDESGHTNKPKKQELEVSSSWKNFNDALDDNFNTPEAISVIFELIKNLNPLLEKRNINLLHAKETIEFLTNINEIFGIISKAKENVPYEIKNVVKIREELREKKKFEEADKIRKHVEEVGYQIDDTSYGPLIKKKS